MKRLTLMLVGAVTMLGLSAGSAFAVPAEMGFTARVSDGSGPITGNVNLGFALFDAATNGTATGWSETYNSVSADAGLVYISLGSQSGLDQGDFDGSDLWLQITVNGSVQTPRLAIGSVPYSIRAATADTLGNLGPGDVALSNHNHNSDYAALSHTHSYAALSHTHNASDINAGTLSDARYSAYTDLGAEGYLDNNAGTDLVTRAQGDARFAALVHTPAAHNHDASNITTGTLNTSRFDAYDDLSVSGRIGTDSTDLPTIATGDARWGATNIASSGSMLTGHIAVRYVANSGGFTVTGGTFRLLTPVSTPAPSVEYTATTSANCPGIGQSNVAGRVCIYGTGSSGVTSVNTGGGNTTATIRHGFSVDVFFTSASAGYLLGSWAYRVP